mmetsp:Transcript_17960/g.14654  ORF Transcript_17960/g.14654 Transcript_17960/m.14654 type:complete len:100 (-) Transcript_17960:1088-1387(-)
MLQIDAYLRHHATQCNMLARTATDYRATPTPHPQTQTPQNNTRCCCWSHGRHAKWRVGKFVGFAMMARRLLTARIAPEIDEIDSAGETASARLSLLDIV